ncbi:MAG: methionine--tRNA ligase [Clostridiales Family XIII bacterium]|nr:methionine--tRNA ligase [Clostridiales Family XIII bacterium]
MAKDKRDKGVYYITTPIYYPSANLHVGHTYCTVMADAMARFKRMTGYDVMFLAGVDEHGQKIQKIAQEKGITPQQHVDEIVLSIKELWKTMEISYDDFIRTTEERHKKRVQAIFKKMYEKGDIYKGEYEGLYCTPCESFWTETQVADGKCPDCGGPLDLAKEPAYFFRLSKYQDRIIELLKNNRGFLKPDSRRNEMLRFVEQGLEDLCISRSSFDWGIPVPIDGSQVIYVWLDALSNYITALGYPDNTSKYEKYWPADVHLVGKEIVRFHSVIWPAMLMSIDEPLPLQVLGHGWLLLEGGKMSKSKGNVVDPVKLIERYGVDALKYFLLREYSFGQDGLYTNEVMLTRINSDLANDLGNLVSRTVSMIEMYNGGEIPPAGIEEGPDADLKKTAVAAAGKVEAHMDRFAFNCALDEIWAVIRRTNKYIDETAPWLLEKDEAKRGRLLAALHNLAESLRIISILICPFMHNTADKIRDQLGVGGEAAAWEDSKVFEKIGSAGPVRVKKGKVIFPRINISKELSRLEEISSGGAAAGEETGKEYPEQKPEIEYDDFAKLDLRVGEIEKAEKHRGADKLLIFQVKMGNETRQVISGVADNFKPEDCVGKKVVVVANLKPRMLRGQESKGMLLFADDGEGFAFVTADASHGEIVS